MQTFVSEYAQSNHASIPDQLRAPTVHACERLQTKRNDQDTLQIASVNTKATNARFDEVKAVIRRAGHENWVQFSLIAIQMLLVDVLFDGVGSGKTARAEATAVRQSLCTDKTTMVMQNSDNLSILPLCTVFMWRI